MEEKKQSLKFYGGFKKTLKILGYLGVVIATFLGVTQVFSWFYPDKARIESSAKFVTFEYPKSMIKDVAVYNIDDSPLKEFHILQVLSDSVKSNSSVSADIYWSQNASRSYALSVQDFSCYTLLEMIEVET